MSSDVVFDHAARHCGSHLAQSRSVRPVRPSSWPQGPGPRLGRQSSTPCSGQTGPSSVCARSGAPTGCPSACGSHPDARPMRPGRLPARRRHCARSWHRPGAPPSRPKPCTRSLGTRLSMALIRATLGLPPAQQRGKARALPAARWPAGRSARHGHTTSWTRRPGRRCSARCGCGRRPARGPSGRLGLRAKPRGRHARHLAQGLGQAQGVATRSAGHRPTPSWPDQAFRAQGIAGDHHLSSAPLLAGAASRAGAPWTGGLGRGLRRGLRWWDWACRPRWPGAGRRHHAGGQPTPVDGGRTGRPDGMAKWTGNKTA